MTYRLSCVVFALTLALASTLVGLPVWCQTVEIVMDNLPPGQSGGGVSFTGNWRESAVTPYFGDNTSLWAGHPDTYPPEATTYRFTPSITQPGVYQVYLYYTAYQNRSEETVVKLQYDGGYSLLFLNMREPMPDPQGGLLIAALPFSAGENSYVELSALNGQCSVDGVRFVYDPANPQTSPQAYSDSTTAVSGIPVEIAALTNDADIDGGRLKISDVTQPAHGTVGYTADALSYVSDSGFEGFDSFTYEVTDGSYRDRATVTVQVIPNDGVWRETRAVWLNNYAFDTEQRRADTLDSITTARLNTVFLAAHPLNGNHGWSEPEDFVAMLAACKQRGLAVHVWVCSRCRVASVDYTDPDERTAQRKWCADWLDTYPELDGYHLDYIRYGRGEYPACIEELTTAVSRTVAGCHEETSAAGRILTAATIRPFRNPRIDGEYAPPWFEQWFARTGGQAPGGWDYQHGGALQLPEFLKVQQDNVGWLLDGDIDTIVSMTYVDSDMVWRWEQLSDASFLEEVDGFDRVSAGLGWYEETLMEPQRLVRKIDYGRLLGLHGFSVFELGHPAADDQPLVDALARGPFSEPAASLLAVAPENAPLAADDEVRMTTGSEIDIDVLANDSDPDGDDLVVLRVLQPAHGKVANHGSHVTYTPLDGWMGKDSFIYTVSDGRGGLAAAEVSIVVGNQLLINESEGSTWVHGSYTDSTSDIFLAKPIDTYEVSLAAQPSAPVEVVITITSGIRNLDLLDPGPSIYPIWRDEISVTIYPESWSVPRRIVVGNGLLSGGIPVACTIKHATKSRDPFADGLETELIATVYPRWWRP